MTMDTCLKILLFSVIAIISLKLSLDDTLKLEWFGKRFNKAVGRYGGPSWKKEVMQAEAEKTGTQVRQLFVEMGLNDKFTLVLKDLKNPCIIFW